MRGDRILLWMCFTLLVGITAWLSFDVDRRLARTEEAVCEAAWANVIASYGTFSGFLTLATEGDELTEEQGDLLLDLTEQETATIDAMIDVCGEPPEILTGDG